MGKFAYNQKIIFWTYKINFRTVKKKGAKTSSSHDEKSWFFYKGSLSENGNPQVPLKSGVRQTDRNHLEDLCANITVRAFSQGLFTMKQIM